MAELRNERDTALAKLANAERGLLRKVSHDDDCALVQDPSGVSPCTCVDIGRELRAELRATERDLAEARRELADWHELSRAVGFAHEPETGRAVVDDAAREAFAAWTVTARRAESDAFERTVERDALETLIHDESAIRLILRELEKKS
jgi:hypothetical protein